MTTLIIARHGNTFAPGETPRRIGARTNLPLVESGREQAKALGRYLKTNNLRPDVVYTSTLKRTQETARIALAEAGFKAETYPLKIFDEIDYGPDENRTEEQVIARIGEQAIKNWDEKALVPPDWKANPQELLKNWQDFAVEIARKHDPATGELDDLHEIVLVLTSNGIARFAPQIAANYPDFHKSYALKLSTGALGILEFSGNFWYLKNWNIRP